MSLTLYLEATTTIPDLFIDYIDEFLVGGQKFMRVKAEPLRGCVASLDPHG